MHAAGKAFMFFWAFVVLKKDGWGMDGGWMDGGWMDAGELDRGRVGLP